MSIIISRNLKNAVRVDRKSFALEDNLQQYIYDNPESIPLYDIKDDVGLLILAREFSTNSGPIDAIGIDKEGELYLVETKLYRNPDKRTVVAQVLDYGASLWKTYVNYETFISSLESHVMKKFGKSFMERVKEFYDMSDEDYGVFTENLKDNLDEGNFKFVVLMDQIHGQLKDLILFINQNSRFNIYGVELEYYKHEEYEILIPRLYGAEVKKELGTKSQSQYIPTDDEYRKMYDTVGLGDEVEQILGLYNGIRENKISISGVHASKTLKNIIFYFTFPHEDKPCFTLNMASISVKSSDNTTIDLWCYDKTKEDVITTTLSKHFPDAKILGKIRGSYGAIAKINIKSFSTDALQAFYSELV